MWKRTIQESAGILAGHYCTTYELTLQMWEQRNTTFVLLLIGVGAAALLTFIAVEAQPLLVDLMPKLVRISDSTWLAEVRSSFPSFKAC